MTENLFSQIDFGPLNEYLQNDDITDISYSNGGQLWLKTLSSGIYRVENPNVNNAMMEKLAFQCSNVMGRSFNAAHPFLDSESAELRMNFVHDSIATNGIACVIRKTPAKIRLQKEKILEEKYITADVHDFLVQCVLAHCNILVAGETGSGKTEFVKYLASKTRENEKLITIEDTLELHLDKIYPHRDIVAMKTNNIASYTEVLVTCMRQNPKWILLSEVRSAEAVTAVRNSISSGHYILSTIHADKAASIPSRLYSLLESSQDMDQFLKSIHRYVQLGVYIRGRQDKQTKKFVREIGEVTEFYVTEDNEAKYNVIYKKTAEGKITRRNPSKYLIDYIEGQGVEIPKGFINPMYEVKDGFVADEGNVKLDDVPQQNIEQPVNTEVNSSIPQENIISNSEVIQQAVNVEQNSPQQNVVEENNYVPQQPVKNIVEENNYIPQQQINAVPVSQEMVQSIPNIQNPN
ncbi:MAG: hypothetical protein E7170_03280 [Firmicutes bacterium]|nr:hypothetical protein [Bacillota bacterium]